MEHLVDIFNVRVTANKSTDLSEGELDAYEYMKKGIADLIKAQVALFPLFNVEIKP